MKWRTYKSKPNFNHPHEDYISVVYVDGSMELNMKLDRFTESAGGKKWDDIKDKVMLWQYQSKIFETLYNAKEFAEVADERRSVLFLGKLLDKWYEEREATKISG